MEEKKVTKDQIIKGVGIGLGITLSFVAGYAYCVHSIGNGQFGFTVLDNQKTGPTLKITLRTKWPNIEHWWKWHGKETKEIVDHLYDQLYPGD